MGLFGSSSSDAASGSGSGAATAPEQTIPTRSARQECWRSRDAYYACLTDKKLLVPPGTDMGDGRAPGGGAKATAADVQRAQERQRRLAAQRDSDPCIELRGPYEKSCAHSWIDYFNKRRVMEERQRMTLEQDTTKYGKSANRLSGQ